MIDRSYNAVTVPRVSNPEAKVQLYRGSCVDVLSDVPDGFFSFGFADPPFNIGEGYDVHDDSQSNFAFDNFMLAWLCEYVRVIERGGTLCVHVPDALAYLVMMIMDKHRVEWGVASRGWIIQHYRFGECQTGGFISSRCHLLVYGRPCGECKQCADERRKTSRGFGKRPGVRVRCERFTWNPESVMVASDRASTYKDKRTKSRSEKSKAKPGERLPFDVWGIPSDGPNWGRVQGGNAERVSIKKGYIADHPNQLPERYVRRAMLAYSDPVDDVVIPFGGAGTEMVVANSLGRNVLGCELSPEYCQDILKRLATGAVRHDNMVDGNPEAPEPRGGN